jgi:hypothetical protein
VAARTELDVEVAGTAGPIRVALVLQSTSPPLGPRIPHPSGVRTTTDRVVYAVSRRMKSGVHSRGATSFGRSPGVAGGVRTVLMDTDHCGIDRYGPVQVPAGVGHRDQSRQHPIPGFVSCVAAMSLPHRLPRPEMRREISPGRPGPQSIQHPLDHHTIVPELPPPEPVETGQQQREQPPLLVRQHLKPINNVCHTEESAAQHHKSLEDTPLAPSFQISQGSQPPPWPNSLLRTAFFAQCQRRPAVHSAFERRRFRRALHTTPNRRTPCRRPLKLTGSP